MEIHPKYSLPSMLDGSLPRSGDMTIWPRDSARRYPGSFALSDGLRPPSTRPERLRPARRRSATTHSHVRDAMSSGHIYDKLTPLISAVGEYTAEKILRPSVT